MASRAWGTCSREPYIFLLFENGKDSYGISISSARWITNEYVPRWVSRVLRRWSHHPDCTWSIGIFMHTYLFSCKLCGSRAGFKWDFERHRSGRLQCSFQHARTSMLRCQICRFDKLHHTVIVCIQADFKIWVEILAVRPSSCCVPSLLLWVRSSSRSTSRTTM